MEIWILKEILVSTQKEKRRATEEASIISEYMYHHEQNVARNMSIKGAFYEVLVNLGC